MKKMKQIFLFSLLLGGAILMSKCQDDSYLDDVQTEQIQKKSNSEKEKVRKKIKYKGLTVNHRFNSTENELKEKHTQKYLKKLYNKLRKKHKKLKNKGVSSKVEEIEVELPSPEVIFEASKVVINDFPYQVDDEFGYTSLGQTKDLNPEMIRSDFDFVDENNFEDNSETLDEYYSQNFDYAVLEEIARNPEIYNSTTIKKSEATIAACTILFLGFEYGFVRTTIAYLSATPKAKRDADTYYNNLAFSGSNDRKDAYRHVLWSSLLAQYYFTISSKNKRLAFSEAVTNLRETQPFCGTANEVDSREMDYHNNRIGRELWSSHTTYRKFLWIKIALNRPKTADLLTYAFNKVEKESCFIVKDHPDGIIFDFSKYEVKSNIDFISSNTVVYFDGDIAPRRYVTNTIYDYSNCNDNLEPTVREPIDIRISEDDADMYDCPRIKYTTRTINACYISKDTNYNPY